MVGPIHPHSKTHNIGGTGPKEVYSRELHELKMSVEAAAGDIIVDNLPNYRAIIQASKSAKSLKGRVTVSTGSSKTETTETATQVDLAAAKRVLRHKGHLAQAHLTKHTTPFSTGRVAG